MTELFRDVDVAAAGKFSRRHVHKLNATARIPKPIRVGRCLRWRANDIAKWFDLGCPSRDQFEALTKSGRAT
jgi:predicted DNA-binding transcriptional regulator AlpA